ncbi:MAG: MmcQ/YjbR family DNA-binding protein [Actinomycetota bacterium]
MAKKTRIDQVCTWCADQPAATMDNTFGPGTNVYRVADKMFALVNIEGSDFVTLKALPEDGAALRAQYDFVREGYYMNKRHWMTIDLVDEAPMDEIRELIEESYHLVFENLPKKRQTELRPS